MNKFTIFLIAAAVAIGTPRALAQSSEQLLRNDILRWRGLLMEQTPCSFAALTIPRFGNDSPRGITKYYLTEQSAAVWSLKFLNSGFDKEDFRSLSAEDVDKWFKDKRAGTHPREYETASGEDRTLHDDVSLRVCNEKYRASISWEGGGRPQLVGLDDPIDDPHALLQGLSGSLFDLGDERTLLQAFAQLEEVQVISNDNRSRSYIFTHISESSKPSGSLGKRRKMELSFDAMGRITRFHLPEVNATREFSYPSDAVIPCSIKTLAFDGRIGHTYLGHLLNEPALDPKMFYLSHYGLPEPATEGRTLWLAYAVVAVGLSLLVIGVIRSRKSV